MCVVVPHILAKETLRSPVAYLSVALKPDFNLLDDKLFQSV